MYDVKVVFTFWISFTFVLNGGELLSFCYADGKRSLGKKEGKATARYVPDYGMFQAVQNA